MTTLSFRAILGRWLLCSLPLLAMLAAIWLLFEDATAADWAFRVHRDENQWAKTLMRAFSDWGNPVLYALAALCLFRAWRKGEKRRVRYWLTFAALQIFISFFLVRVTKIALGSPRPDASDRLFRPMTLDASHHSLPSGHTAESTGTATALALAWPNVAAGLVLGVFIGLIAFSRIYLSWHSPSDVFFGWLFGSTAGIFAAVLADVRWSRLFSRSA